MKGFIFSALVLLATSGSGFAATKFYMSPTGNDANNGTSQTQAVKTLGRVQAILVAIDPSGPVEVHIAPGTYAGQTVIWTYFNGDDIVFTPLDFGTVRPVFDGQGSPGIWFNLVSDLGIETNLKFRYLEVRNYNTAMSFAGNRDVVDKSLGWNGGNELNEMIFRRIGGKYSSHLYSTAAVRLVNSRNNRILNSVFIDIENDPPQSGEPNRVHALHAIYVAHRSSGNLIQGNSFENNSGDPVRIRDSSDYNKIFNNAFAKTGSYAYAEWFCSSSNIDCTAAVPECPSFGNEFRENVLDGGYAGAIGYFKLYTPIEDACPRLRTSGNINL